MATVIISLVFIEYKLLTVLLDGVVSQMHEHIV